MEKTVRHGRDIKRFREMFGIKQEALAFELDKAHPEHGEGTWNQKKISLLEAKEIIDDGLIEEVAKVLKVPGDAIRRFDEEATISIISNTFSDFKDNASAINYHIGLSFNPIEKIVELYEALLKSEREKIELSKGI